MAPRARKFRKILNPPPMKGFKPYGYNFDGTNKEPVLIHFEEYEALRLCDYDMHNHHQASVIMGVSRPTFTRIYASVRRKVAKAFAENRQIKIQGGKVYFDSNWYSCSTCGCFFNNPKRGIDAVNCPLCDSKDVANYDIDTESVDADVIGVKNMEKGAESPIDMCVCVGCGYEKLHNQGVPCKTEVCPQCGQRLTRKIKAN